MAGKSPFRRPRKRRTSVSNRNNVHQEQTKTEENEKSGKKLSMGERIQSSRKYNPANFYNDATIVNGYKQKPVIQRTPDKEESVSAAPEMISRSEAEPLSMVAAGSQASITSFGGLDKALIDLLNKNPDMTVQDALRQAVEVNNNASPMLTERGNESAADALKRALILYNVHYPHDNDLEEVGELAPQMAAALQSRSYDVSSASDLGGAAMLEQMLEFVRTGEQGNEYVIYYSGHGEFGGIKGVDEVHVSPSDIYMLREEARMAEINLTVILEACHTGSTTDFIRMEDSFNFATEGLTSGNDALYQVAQAALGLQEIKNELTQFEYQRGQLLNGLDEEGVTGEQVDAAVSKYEEDFKKIEALWIQKMVEVQVLIHQIESVAPGTYTLPTSPSDFATENGTNLITRNLDQMDTLIGEVLKTAETLAAPQESQQP